MNSSGGPLANTRSAPQPFLRPHPEAEQQLARALLLEQSHAAASNLAALRRPLAVSPLPTSPHHVYQLPLAIQPSVAFRPRPLPPSRSFSSGFPTPAYVQLAMQQQLLQQQQLELEWQFQRLQQVRNMQLLASQSGASGLSPSTTPDLHPVGWNPPIGRPSAAQTLPRTVTPAAAGYPNYQLPARPYLVTTPVPAVKGPTPKAAIPSSVSPITGQSYQSSGQHEGDEWDYSSPSKVHTRQVYGSESSFSSAVPPQLTITKDHAIRGVQVQKGPTPTTNSSKSTTVLLQSLMALMDDSSFLAHGESTGIYRRSSFRDLSGTFDSVKDLVHITNPSTDSVDKRIELMGKSARKEINEGKPYPVIGPRSDSMALDSSGWEREKGPSLHRARSVRRGATGSKPSSVGPSKKGVVPSPRNKHRNPLNAITNAKLTEESDPPQRNPLSNVNVNLAAENVEPLHLKATDKSRSSLSNEVSLAPSKVESPLRKSDIQTELC
ncbi:hypothetical protein DFJ73DRAFT_809771 [Zopfochytrium polystomum]|nr:hypothetical protein DFJ73DRAFT_809771 [Zopfochytrium polystomum]